jgi:hypothetical protein
MSNDQKPVAWAFYHKDGTLRFIVDDERRMLAWKSAHDGDIIPLVHKEPNNQNNNIDSQA